MIKKGDKVRLLYQIDFPNDDFSNGKPVRRGVYTVKAGTIGIVKEIWNTSPQKTYIVKFAGIGEAKQLGEIEVEAPNALDLLTEEETREKPAYRRSC